MESTLDLAGPFAPAREALRESMQNYAQLEPSTWRALVPYFRGMRLAKGEFFTAAGSVPTTFGFVYTGLLRVYVSGEDGNEYNKVFFDEGTFPGSMAALLTAQPSDFAIQALEDTCVVRIDFAGYRRLLKDCPDLMWFHIQYLEKNWLLKKEPRELALVQDGASKRYRRFIREHPGLYARLPLFHVASHLGITPTQLSRIRKANQPM